MRVLHSRSSDSTPGSWDDFWYTIKTSKRIVAIVLLATVAGAYIGLQTQDDLYESEARILVKFGRENMDAPVTVERGVVTSMGIRKEEIFTNVALLSSQPLIQQALDEIGVDAFRPPKPPPSTVAEKIRRKLNSFGRGIRNALEDLLVALNLEKRLSYQEKLLLGLRKALVVERDKESDVILAKLTLPSPELAQRFLGVLISRYRDAHIEVRKDTNSSDLFQKKTGDYLEKINAYAKEKEKVRTDYALSSIDEERRQLLARQHVLYSELETDRRNLALVPKVNKSDTNLTSGDLSTSNPSTQLMRNRITEQRIRRIEMSSLFRPDSEQIRNIDAEIASLELAFSRALRQSIAMKQPQVAEIEQRLSVLNVGERKLEELERERHLALQHYSAYAKRWEEARISEELDRRRVANISVLSAPTLPVKPVKPHRLLIMTLSILGGLVLGIAAAVVRESFSNRIRRPSDLARIDGLAFLGTFDLKRS